MNLKGHNFGSGTNNLITKFHEILSVIFRLVNLSAVVCVVVVTFIYGFYA